MSHFNLENALANANANLSERQSKTKSLCYVLYYSNNGKQPEGKMTGYTIKQIIGEFRELGQKYRYAFITKVNSDKTLRFYDSHKRKTFFSMTRTKSGVVVGS